MQRITEFSCTDFQDGTNKIKRRAQKITNYRLVRHHRNFHRQSYARLERSSLPSPFTRSVLPLLLRLFVPICSRTNSHTDNIFADRVYVNDARENTENLYAFLVCGRGGRHVHSHKIVLKAAKCTMVYLQSDDPSPDTRPAASCMPHVSMCGEMHECMYSYFNVYCTCCTVTVLRLLAFSYSILEPQCLQNYIECKYFLAYSRGQTNVLTKNIFI